MITFHCLECDGELYIDDSAALGQKISCMFCGSDFEVVAVDPIEVDWSDEDDDLSPDTDDVVLDDALDDELDEVLDENLDDDTVVVGLDDPDVAKTVGLAVPKVVLAKEVDEELDDDLDDDWPDDDPLDDDDLDDDDDDDGDGDDDDDEWEWDIDDDDDDRWG